ncbi:hypothetical protein IPZ68_12005 [Streptomyces arenae]|nr:hypothetical protein [Streptomyces arenae]
MHAGSFALRVGLLGRVDFELWQEPLSSDRDRSVSPEPGDVLTSDGS